MANTKKPSGLYISRNNLDYTFNWKISDEDYKAGQQLQYRIHTGRWSPWYSISIGTGTTAVKISLKAADYWPNKKKHLYRLEFRVRGKRHDVTKDGKTTTYTWSDWAINAWNQYAPRVPTISASFSDEFDNRTTFSWKTNITSSDDGPFHSVEYQTILVKESNVTDGSKLRWKSSTLGWETGSTGANGSKVITEDTELLARNSYTRWVRVRSRGPGGTESSRGARATGSTHWRYAKHVYAMPHAPSIKKVKRSGSWVRVNWKADQNASHPIDLVTVQWAIGIPRSNMAAPENPSWHTERTFRDTSGADEALFLVDQNMGIDECMWVRIGVEHDRNWRATVAKLVGAGKLATPSELSVESDSTTFRATVTATNNSAVPDSRLAVVFRMTGAKDVVVGIIPHGSDTVTVQCPDWSEAKAVAFGVYAFQGKASGKTKSGITTYAMVENMKSAELWSGGSVPIAPTGVTAEMTDTSGEVLLTWNWSWNKANRTEISWAQNVNAWESTEEPDTYLITNLHAAKWRVSGLETGVTWYFRIRLAQETSDGISYGPYSEPIGVDLSSEPAIPLLTLSDAVVTEGATITASWVYSTTDGKQQSYAEICEATVSGETVTYGSVIAHATTAQHVGLEVPETWEYGSTHHLCVRVSSESGRISEWSDPVSITVAEPIECVITATSLEDVEEDGVMVKHLTAMPLTANITGAGEGGLITLIIERAKEYHVIRPDETIRDGFDGETVAIIRQNGDGEISVAGENLIGLLDDGAMYRLTAMVADGLGQSDMQEIEFKVKWDHQAEAPTATIEMVDGAAVITAVAPESAEEGDVCDIYRLTAEKPELIVRGGTFGTPYVDPYPAIGKRFGHRVVDRTVNGDYITEEGTPAWIDLGESEGDFLDLDFGIIDFDGEQLRFAYNIEQSTTWSKEFVETKYLGGAVTGDWNLAVGRTETINAKLIYDDEDAFRTLRRLASYTGICHVRTPEGSSFSADVQVSESMNYQEAGRILNLSLTITRVDGEEPDGIPYSEWAP